MADGQRHVLETLRLETGPELGEGEGAGDAARIGAELRAPLRRERVVGDDVGYADPPARPQDAGDLPEDGRLVGGEIDHAIADDHVDRGRGQWNGLDVTSQPLDVRGAGRGCVALSERQHLVGHVQPKGPAARPNASCGEQHVDAPARAQVQDALAFVQVGHGDGITAAQRGHDGGAGQFLALQCRVELAAVVAGIAAARLAGGDAERGLGVVQANRFVDGVGCPRRSGGGRLVGR